MRRTDPLQKLPEPVTLLLPVIQEGLRKAGLTVSRDRIIQRFFDGRPRIVIVSGSDDHPAHIYDDLLIRMLMKDIWLAQAIPFQFKTPAICDGVAQGHPGMEFSLRSRDLTSELVFGQIMAHHYDAAFFLSGCDKNPSGFLGAAIKVQASYRSRFKKNFPFIFLNTPVMKPLPLPPLLKRKFQDLPELKDLIQEDLTCNVYAGYFKVLNDLEAQGRITNKGKLLRELAKHVCMTGGTCAFMGTGNTSKLVLFGLGLVPDEFALPTREDYLHPEHAKKAVSLILGLWKKNFDCVEIVKQNFQNSIMFLASIQGSLNWVLHFQYLSGLLGQRGDLLGTMDRAPVLYQEGTSVYTMARKRELFPMMKFLLLRRTMKDHETISGKWKERLKSTGLKKNLVPGRSGILSFKGNLFKQVLIKVSEKERESLRKFHEQVLLCLVYHSEEDFLKDVLKKGRIMRTVEKLKKKNRLKKTFLALFILKQGYKDRGMPEMYYASEFLNRDHELREKSILITDGRFSGATYGLCFGYMEPEYTESKKLQRLRTGDLMRFDLYRQRMDLIKR